MQNEDHKQDLNTASIRDVSKSVPSVQCFASDRGIVIGGAVVAVAHRPWCHRSPKVWLFLHVIIINDTLQVFAQIQFMERILLSPWQVATSTPDTCRVPSAQDRAWLKTLGFLLAEDGSFHLPYWDRMGVPIFVCAFCWTLTKLHLKGIKACILGKNTCSLQIITTCIMWNETALQLQVSRETPVNSRKCLTILTMYM